MLGKLYLFSAVIFPFVRTRARERYLVRGGHALEGSSPELSNPVEDLGPLPDTSPTSEDSPCLDLPLVSSHLRLVHDASATGPTPEDRVQDASETFNLKALRTQAFDRRKLASTGKFVRWLAENHSGEDLTKTRLLALYFDYTEGVDRRPLKERQLLNNLSKYGVIKTRPTAVIVDGKQKRPTYYRVKPSKREEAAA